MVRSAEARGTREVAPSGDRRGGEFQLSSLFPHSYWIPPKPDVPRSEHSDPVEAKILRLRGAEELARGVDANLFVVEVRGAERPGGIQPTPIHATVRLDQETVIETGKVCTGLYDAENQYTQVGRDRLFEKYSSVY